MRRQAQCFAVLLLLLAAFGTACAQSVEAQPQKNADAPESVFERARQRLSKVPLSERYGPTPFAEAALALKQAQILASKGADAFGIADAAPVEQALSRLEESLRRIKGDLPPQRPGRTGFQERAYFSPIDDSAQPYLLYVPSDYLTDGEREWPLLVFLHGYYSALDCTNWIEFMYSPTLEALCEREGVILLMPFGRSNTEFMGIGEDDVLQTMAYVQEEYRIDPRRIILSGASMGGSGTYTIAAHHPDRFAGLATITGRVDYYLWMGVAREELPPYKRAQIDTDYVASMPENLGPMPIVAFHGAFDRGFAEQSRRLNELARLHELDCRIVEFPYQGHYIWSSSFKHPHFERLLKESRLAANPKRVVFTTWSLKYPSAWWARVGEIARWGDPARIEAEVLDGNRIRVTTTNVAAFSLGPAIPGVQANAHVTIEHAGRSFEVAPDEDGIIRMSLDQAAAPTGGLRKTSGLCGPIREAWAQPFVIVFPSGDDAASGRDRQNAAGLIRAWLAYARGTPRICSDNDVTERIIEEYNLILIGTTATNEVTKRIAGDLPITITAEEYGAGPHRYEAVGRGMQCVYPNPLNPERLVLLIDGVAWAPEVQVNHKLDFLPDYIIYTAETVRDGTWFPTNRALCAGYFDSAWRWDEASCWCDEAPQEETEPQAAPAGGAAE